MLSGAGDVGTTRHRDGPPTRRRQRGIPRGHGNRRAVVRLVAVTGLLALVAGLVLLGSLFVGWYEFHYEGVAPPTDGPDSAHFAGGSTFLPGSSFQSSAGCSGDPQFCSAGNQNHSTAYPYDNNGTVVDAYPNTGTVYGFLQLDLVVAAALALGGGTLLLRSANSRMPARRTVSVIVAIGLTVALAAPLAVWIGTPLATHLDYTADFQGRATNFTGPGGSFWGSCGSPSCGSGGGVMDSWGPVTGWYAGWGAVSLLVATLVLHLIAQRGRTRSTPPEPGTPSGVGAPGTTNGGSTVDPATTSDRSATPEQGNPLTQNSPGHRTTSPPQVACIVGARRSWVTSRASLSERTGCAT